MHSGAGGVGELSSCAGCGLAVPRDLHASVGTVRGVKHWRPRWPGNRIVVLS